MLLRNGFDQIAHAIRTRIGNGMYPVGTRLPPLRDLAEEFAVTTATVSRALRPLVEARLVESRERSGVFVVDTPTKNTVQPRSGSSRLVGFIAFDTVVSPYWSVVVSEIEQYVRGAGYNLVLGNSNLEVEQALRYVESFAKAGVEGIIFVPFDAPDVAAYDRTNGAVLRALHATGLPYVLYDRTVGDRQGAPATVGIDNEHYTEKLLEHLSGRGCTRPLALSVSYSSTIVAREAVFMARFPDAQADNRLVRLPTRRVTDEYLDAVATAVDRDDVDGLFLVNSSVLNGYLRARESGLLGRLPASVPFVAFEDFPVRGSNVAVARAIQAIGPLAQAAAEVCIDRIEHQGGIWGNAHIEVRLPCRLLTAADEETRGEMKL